MIENKILQAIREDELELTMRRRIRLFQRVFGDRVYKIKPPTLSVCIQYAEILVKLKVKDNDPDAEDEIAKIIINNESQFAEYLSVLISGKKSRRKGRKYMKQLTVVDLTQLIQITAQNMGVSNFATSIVTLNASSLIKAAEIIAAAKKQAKEEKDSKV